MYYENDLITSVYIELDRVRAEERVCKTEWALRLQISLYELSRRFRVRTDMKLSTIARMAHAIGKRVVVTLVDEA